MGEMVLGASRSCGGFFFGITATYYRVQDHCMISIHVDGNKLSTRNHIAPHN